MKQFMILFFVSFLSISLSAHDKMDHGKWKKEHFKKMDLNGDGKISKEEWQKFHESKFSDLDKNADGFVTEEELSNFHKEMKDKMGKKD